MCGRHGAGIAHVIASARLAQRLHQLVGQRRYSRCTPDQYPCPGLRNAIMPGQPREPEACLRRRCRPACGTRLGSRPPSPRPLVREARVRVQRSVSDPKRRSARSATLPSSALSQDNGQALSGPAAPPDERVVVYCGNVIATDPLIRFEVAV